MSETIYPKGLRTFPPRDEAPDFVKGTLIVTPSELNRFCADNPNLMTDYKGTPQLRLNILLNKNDRGVNLNVDTWRPDANQQPETPPEVDGNMGDSSQPLPF